MPRCRFAACSFVLALAAFGGTGCHSAQTRPEPIPDLQLPKELNKVSLPVYTVESPDILLIDSIRVVPKPPYKVQPLDALYLRSPNALKEEPLDGIYPVEPDGTINLGLSYGGVHSVVGKTVTEIEKELTKKVRDSVKDMTLTVSLAQARGAQQISGQHLVRPDGTIGLGNYGAVYVAGMTLQQVKAA
jgi:polysaccharide biosynthesis/export protein